MGPQDLSLHAKNITSQFGEDGIIAEIFERIGVRHSVCVEFGAWDGRKYSNTWDLWHDKGWRAILIEGHPERFQELREATAPFGAVRAIQLYVTPDGDTALDEVLVRQGLPEDFDLLSVDIDGDEFHVWESVRRFRPRVVVVEHNPTIPPKLDLVQLRGEYFGASAKALVQLGKEKGYTLAACTQTNSIFVRDQDFGLLQMPAPDLDGIFPQDNLTYVVSAYDGRTFITRNPTYSATLPTMGARTLLSLLWENLFTHKTIHSTPLHRGALTPAKVLLPPDSGAYASLRSRIFNAMAASFMGALAAAVTPITRPIVERYRRWRGIKDTLAKWDAAGRPVPPPDELKRSVVLRYAKKHRIHILVETGTYLGDMVAAVHQRFSKVISVELDQKLYQQARKRFASLPHVELLQGDSAKVLPKVLEKLDGRALFWLDGHYSGGVTAKGDTETPIVEELEHIFANRIEGHVVLIDDARCFDGTHDYPDLEKLKAFVRLRRPHAKFEVVDDIVRIS